MHGKAPHGGGDPGHRCDAHGGRSVVGFGHGVVTLVSDRFKRLPTREPTTVLLGAREYTMNELSRHRLNAWAAGMVAAFLTVFSAVCVLSQPIPSEPGKISSTAMWAELLQRMPFPYRIPLPELKRTDLDGTYVKVVVSKTERVHCLRCPDYAPEGGSWKLNVDRGIFRIFHPESGWKSIATAIITGDRMVLANDPTCIEDIGVYRWRLEKGRLMVEVIDDPCAIKLRATNLTQQPWLSCRPPNIEAAVTEHWPKPEGCD